MFEKILENLGLSEKEVKIYLTCLKLGPASVRHIAEESEINRGTAYDILRGLINLGLVSYYHRDKKQYFIAEEPKKLKEAIKQKQNQLEETKIEIDRIIPELNSMYNKAGAKPVVRYYEGYTGIKLIMEDVIRVAKNLTPKEYYVYSSSTIKEYLYNVYPKFSHDRIQAGIKVKVISIGPGGQTRGLDERKWLTKEESTPTYTLIYGGRVAIISIDLNHKPIGVIIEDVHIYQTQKMMFEFIWSKL